MSAVIGQATELFRYWDLRIYSPLSIALAVTSYLAVRVKRRERDG